MMTNLFWTFDPATSTKLSMNWISIMIGLMIMPKMYWMMNSRSNNLIITTIMNLHKEFKTLLGVNSQGMFIMMVSMFMFILLNNMMGLLPYIFTSSSHLTFSLSMALPMWSGLMIFGWANKSQKMFARLIPNGTPAPLMPFMVMIETISNLIRPTSLAVRLTANMIAGHLLMSLLGGMTENPNMYIPIIFSMQIMLMMFETAVSIIQAYVFSILTTLYSSEVTYVKM